MYKDNNQDSKEFNAVLQNKLSKITYVLPKEHKTEIQHNADIFDSVKPFFTVLQLIGLQQMTFKKNDAVPSSWFYKLYSFFVAFAILAIQSYVLFNQYTTNEESKSPATVVVELLKVIPPTISAIICLIFSATSYQSMIIRVVKNIKIVDRQLVVENKNIYIPMRNKVTIFIIGMLLLSVLMNGFDYWVHEKLRMLIVSFVISLNEFVLLEVCLLLYIVTTRLDILNTQLNATKYDASQLFNNEVSIIKKRKDLMMMSVVENFETLDPKKNKKLPEEEKGEDVVRLMKVYDRLADNSNIVNSCFGIPLLSSAIAAFMNILSTVNDLITINKDLNPKGDEYKNMNLAIWCLRDVLFVVMVTIAIEAMLSRVKKTSNIINKLSINPKIDLAREELLDRFSQLMSCRKFTITACNFFPFDFTFIYSLVGAIATYTVIILQVNPPAQNDKPA